MQSYQRFQHIGHTAFNTSGANGPHSLLRMKVGTHSPLPTGSHAAAYTAKQGAFQMGALLLPSERSTRFGNPAWPGFKTANFAAFGSWLGVLQKDAESLRNSDALMHVAVPRRRGPAGLRDLFRFCRNCGLYALRSGPFRVCEARGVSPLSACSTYRRNARCPLVNAANSPFPCLARFFFDSSSAKYCPLSLQMPKGPAGYPLGLSLLFASPYLP